MIEELRNAVIQKQNDIISLLTLDYDFEKLKQEKRDYSYYLNKFKQQGNFTTMQEIIFLLGKLEGTLDCADNLAEVYEQNNYLIKQKKVTTKYFEPVLEILENNEGISHGQLAQKLGINPNQLSNVMRKIVASGAVQKESVGKSSYYFLTDSAKYFLKTMRE